MRLVLFLNILCGCVFLLPVKSSRTGDIELKFTSQPTDVTVAVGSTVTIPCVARSSSSLSYTWTRNGTVLEVHSSSGRYRLTGRDGNLTIINTTLHDAGEYRCIASNGFGSALSLRAVLRVAYLHGRSPSNHTVTATMFSTVKLPISSKVESYPRVHFTWSHKMQNSRTFDVIADGQKGRLLIALSGDLYIVGVKSEDAGTFRCVISNPLVGNEVTVHFKLIVLEGAVDGPLSFLVPPVSVAAVIGDPLVVFECIVTTPVVGGRPQVPEITWHQNNTELDPDSNPNYGYPNSGISRHKLLIYELDFSDQGLFRCIATTASDVITSPSAQLVVNNSPVFPSFTAKLPSVMYPQAGIDVTLDCPATVGNVSWYKNAVNVLALPSSKPSVTSNGGLLMRNVSHVDSGLYQAFVRTSAGEVSTSPVGIHVVDRSPPTTLGPLPSVTTAGKTVGATSTKASDVPTTFHSVQSTTETGATRKPTHTVLNRTVTTSAALIPGNKAKNKTDGMTTPLLYGTAVGGVVIFLLAVVAVFCFIKHRGSKGRRRQGSVKLKCQPDQDSEEFEMQPVVKRDATPARRALSVHRHVNSESTLNLLGSRISNDRLVSVDTNDNQFFISPEFHDHASSYVNPSLTSELSTSSPTQHIPVLLYSEPSYSTRKSRTTRVPDEPETSEAGDDSGIEDEVSERFRKSSGLSEFYISEENDESLGLYQTVKKTKEDGFPLKQDNAFEMRNKDIELCVYGEDSEEKDIGTTRSQATEPIYYVLEGPGEDLRNYLERGTGPKLCQSLVQNESSAPTERIPTEDQDSGFGFAEEFVSSIRYQSLTPPKHDDVLNNAASLPGAAGSSIDTADSKHVLALAKGIYQPLVHKNNVPHLPLHSDRPRSVSGVYQPLRRGPRGESSLLSENEEERRRCMSAPQESMPQVSRELVQPVNGREGMEPIYQTVAEEDRCPLNYDEDPGTSPPHVPRPSPRPSPLAQRRTIQEPTYFAVRVGSSPPRFRRRPDRSEHEPRYSPSPARKNTPAQQVPVPASNTPRGHRRNFSDSGHSSAPDRLNPLGPRLSGPSPLPRRLGHRRNMSDIGRCPINLSDVPSSQRPVSDAVLPRSPSLGSIASDHHGSPGDMTHCRVDIGP